MAFIEERERGREGRERENERERNFAIFLSVAKSVSLKVKQSYGVKAVKKAKIPFFSIL